MKEAEKIERKRTALGVMTDLTEKERRLLEIIRSVEFGEVRIVVTDGVPTRVEEIKRSIKL